LNTVLPLMLHPGMMFVAWPFKTCFACGDWTGVPGNCEGRARIAHELRGPARQACACSSSSINSSSTAVIVEFLRCCRRTEHCWQARPSLVRSLESGEAFSCQRRRFPGCQLYLQVQSVARAESSCVVAGAQSVAGRRASVAGRYRTLLQAHRALLAGCAACAHTVRKLAQNTKTCYCNARLVLRFVAVVVSELVDFTCCSCCVGACGLVVQLLHRSLWTCMFGRQCVR
jgi:hypothetical protein